MSYPSVGNYWFTLLYEEGLADAKAGKPYVNPYNIEEWDVDSHHWYKEGYRDVISNENY